MTALRVFRSERPPVTVVLNRTKVEEAFVDIQSASDEVVALLNRAHAQLIANKLIRADESIAGAETLARLIGQAAWSLAGEVREAPGA